MEADKKAEKDDEEKPVARQNSVLRRYFREQYISFAGDGVYLNRTFMERYVDRQIDHFLADTEKRLDELNRRAQLTCEAWRDFSEAPESRQAVKVFKDALEDLEDSADSLGDRLAGIFKGLSQKATLPALPEDRDPAAIAETLALLETDADGVRVAVHDYLFEPSHVVELETLGEDDILARLYRLEKVASSLRKGL